MAQPLSGDQDDLVIVHLMQTIAALQRRPKTARTDWIISECRRIILECEKSKAMTAA
jgi:hypothetical protein